MHAFRSFFGAVDIRPPCLCGDIVCSSTRLCLSIRGLGKVKGKVHPRTWNKHPRRGVEV